MMTFAEKMAAELNPDGVPNLVAALEASCEKYAEMPAFDCLGDSITFAEFNALTHTFAKFLRDELGLVKGDRLAIQLPNITQYPVAVWGAWRAGLVVVNTNPMYTAREQIHQFNDSGASALVVFDALLPVTKTVLPDTDIRNVIVVSGLGDDAEDHPFIEFSTTLAQVDVGDEEFPNLSMQDLAVLQYTGGTTGPSKGAMLTHGNLFSSVMLSRQSVVLKKPDDPEIMIAILPLYHVFGFTQNVVSGLLHGAVSIMIPDPRKLEHIIGVMKAYRFTGFVAVNTLLAGLMKHPDFDDIDFSSITGVIAGGTALVKEIANEWCARTGTMIYEGYGLSETTAVTSCNRPESNQLGTVGPVMDAVQIKTISEDGAEVPVGSAGEVCVRGPNVMTGYWGRPEATAEAIDDEGWFRTGDIGIILDNGHLKIVDRIKDMILVSGFNVYPNEVEAVVYGHPSITECAAIGVPDDNTGEAIKLFVVCGDKSVTTEELIAFCKTELTAYKVPKQIEFKSDLPKSPAGKVLRRELRD